MLVTLNFISLSFQSPTRQNTVLNFTLLFLALTFIVFLIFLVFWAIRKILRTKREISEKLSTLTRDDQAFMLTSIQHLVNRLREKEMELEELHRKEKLRADEAERLSSDIVRNLTDGLILWSPAGKLLTLNPSAEKIFKISRLVALNQTYWKFFEQNELLINLIKQALEEKKSLKFPEFEFSFKNGNKIIMEITLSPLFGKKGEFIGLLSIFKDITEEKKLKEIAKSKEELALIGELSAGITHEFRNSLGVILGHSRLLEKEIKDKTSVYKITKEANFLLEMVDKFLSFAKPIDLKKEKLNLENLIDETLEEFKEEPKEELTITKSGVFPEIEGDKNLLKTVFSNLFRNSLEAGASKIKVESKWKKNQKEAEIIIKDNGIGFSENLKEKIFLPFFTTKERGTGMGLAFVKKIITNHQGRISVNSTKNKGTTFSLILPVIIEDSL